MTKRSKTAEEFIADAKRVHGDRYDYSLVEYVNSNTNVVVVCKEHGVFKQRPNGHLRKNGCAECGKEKRNFKNTKTFDYFLKKAKIVHGDKYTYSNYTKLVEKLNIKCGECGHVFEQRAWLHLRGQGCKKCAVESRKLGKDEFVKRAVQKHGTKFDYTKVDYKKDRIKTLIKCNRCNSSFEQTPRDHLKIKGCPICENSGGFDKNKKAILYYLKVVTNIGIFYKIGITNRTVEERYRSEDLAKIEIINIVKYKNGRDCYDAEQNILKEYSQYRYVGSKILKSCGDTELFTKDVLGLDV